MNKILVVEDEVITSDLLRRFFEIVGYEVLNVLNGTDAIKVAQDQQPRVIILDIMLPDMDGYDVCRKLRADDKTKNIPIIFLTQKDDRRDKLEGLELGADDYITKPFDVEELRLRVHNIIGRTGGTPLVDPRTSLPNMALIKERLPKLLTDDQSVFLDVEIQHFAPFSQQYGPVASNQVIRSAAKVIGDLLHEIDPTNTFIGHPRDEHFLLVIPRTALERVQEELPDRFAKHIIKFYDFPDQERGKMKVGEEEIPFMAFKLLQIKAETLQAQMQAAAKRELQSSLVKTRKPDGKKPVAEAKPSEADKKEEMQASAAVSSSDGKKDSQAQAKPESSLVEDKKAIPETAKKDADTKPDKAKNDESNDEDEKEDKPYLRLVVNKAKDDDEKKPAEDKKPDKD